MSLSIHLLTLARPKLPSYKDWFYMRIHLWRHPQPRLHRELPQSSEEFRQRIWKVEKRQKVLVQLHPDNSWVLVNHNVSTNLLPHVQARYAKRQSKQTSAVPQTHLHVHLDQDANLQFAFDSCWSDWAFKSVMGKLVLHDESGESFVVMLFSYSYAVGVQK